MILDKKYIIGLEIESSTILYYVTEVLFWLGVTEKFRPCLHRNGSKWNLASMVQICLAFTWELMELF